MALIFVTIFRPLATWYMELEKKKKEADSETLKADINIQATQGPLASMMDASSDQQATEIGVSLTTVGGIQNPMA